MARTRRPRRPARPHACAPCPLCPASRHDPDCPAAASHACQARRPPHAAARRAADRLSPSEHSRPGRAPVLAWHLATPQPARAWARQRRPRTRPPPRCRAAVLPRCSLPGALDSRPLTRSRDCGPARAAPPSPTRAHRPGAFVVWPLSRFSHYAFASARARAGAGAFSLWVRLLADRPQLPTRPRRAPASCLAAATPPAFPPRPHDHPLKRAGSRPQQPPVSLFWTSARPRSAGARRAARRPRARAPRPRARAPARAPPAPRTRPRGIIRNRAAIKPRPAPRCPPDGARVYTPPRFRVVS
jgi:hypothetical protein